MKNLGTILAGVALIGVIYLAFFQNKTKKTADGTGVSTEIAESGKGIRMAYVRADSLQTQYKLFKELSEELKGEEEKIMKDLERKQRDLQIEMNLYQQEAPKMSPQQRQSSEADLMRVEQQYRMYEQQVREGLMAKQMELQENMKSDMDSVLVKMKDELSLDFIMLYDQSSALIYVNEAYNITDVVVGKLNENYDKKKK